MIQSYFWLIPGASILALIVAYYFYRQMKNSDEGTDKMKKIAEAVRTGAKSYLRQQYKVVGIVFIGLLLWMLMC